jgi:hypothetical protein
MEMKNWQITTLMFVIIFAIAIGMFRLVDSVIGLGIYSSLFEKVHDVTGLSDLAAGALTVWILTVFFLFIPTTVCCFLLKRIAAILLIALIFSGWAVVMFFLSQPRDGYKFNPLTGNAQFKYARKSDGKLELFPRSYDYDPHFGTKLADITPEIVLEYEDQLSDKHLKASALITNQQNSQQNADHQLEQLGIEVSKSGESSKDNKVVDPKKSRKSSPSIKSIRRKQSNFRRRQQCYCPN